jgi:hypothetical protein
MRLFANFNRVAIALPPTPRIPVTVVTSEMHSKRHNTKTVDLTFASFPVGTAVSFRSGHQRAHVCGTVISYEVLKGLPYLGELPRIRLQDGSECFAMKPADLTLRE